MKNVCSFCGRSDNEVRLLINGLNGQICDDCARQAYQIVQDVLYVVKFVQVRMELKLLL